LREEKEKSDKAAADLAFKLRQQKRNDDENNDEDKPLTASQLEARLAKERQDTEKRLQKTEAERIVKGLTDSDAEAEFVLEVYNATSFPESWPLERKVRSAYAVANQEKLIGENNELKRALKGRDGVSKDTASGYQDSVKTSESKMSSQDQYAIKASGYKWNGTAKRYEKKLGDGSLLVMDPKTKKTSIISK
jgi:hypothetical protein